MITAEKPARRGIAAVLAIGLLVGAAGDSSAQPALDAPAEEKRDPKPANEQPPEPAAEEFQATIEGFLERLWLPPRSRFTDGPHVREAFRPVVADARGATVQVRAEGRRVAYGGIVGPDGWVLTKASQLRGPVVVRLMSGASHPARVVGIDRDYDLAMLKIDATDLPTLDLRAGGEAAEGALSVSVDLEPTSDPGDDASDDPASETPAPSPDGPRAGDWLATVGYGKDPAAIGVVSVAPRKIVHRPGILGVRIADGDGGVLVERVFDGTGAADAGVEAGDVIVAIDDEPVASRAALQKTIRVRHPGDEVLVGVKRGDKLLRLRAVLTGQVKEFGENRSQYQNGLGGRLSERRFGFPTALQHDTVLRPEDCGGPVVDLDGRVVGFNIARAGRTESYALPTEVVRERLYDLMSGRLAPPARDDAE